MGKKENKSNLTHAIFLTREHGTWGRGWGVTALTKAGSASRLVPTLTVLFIFCQQWQIYRKAFSWWPCRLQKHFTWIISVSEKCCVRRYQMSNAKGSVTEVPWTKASLAPRARGSACVDPKDEWENSSSVYRGKGRLQASVETDAPAHEDERWDAELIYSGLIHGTDYLPRPCICLTELP